MVLTPPDGADRFRLWGLTAFSKLKPLGISASYRLGGDWDRLVSAAHRRDLVIVADSEFAYF